MRNVIIIPARYASTRLPGKPLVPICGVPMLERVWRLAKAIKNIDEVIVATDDERIVQAVENFGGQAVMTDENCPNGTARCFEAVQKLSYKPNIIVNMQGDAPITPPWVVENLVQDMMQRLTRNEPCDIATPAVCLSWDARKKLLDSKKQTPSSGTTVVFDKNNKALYFSKNVLPFCRHEETGNELSPTWRHIGLYAYTYKALEAYLSFEETELENAEKLEQLRALYHGLSVYVVPVDYQGRTHGSVDSPEDVLKVEAIIQKEGELLD